MSKRILTLLWIHFCFVQSLNYEAYHESNNAQNGNDGILSRNGPSEEEHQNFFRAVGEKWTSFRRYADWTLQDPPMFEDSPSCSIAFGQVSYILHCDQVPSFCSWPKLLLHSGTTSQHVLLAACLMPECEGGGINKHDFQLMTCPVDDMDHAPKCPTTSKCGGWSARILQGIEERL